MAAAGEVTHLGHYVGTSIHYAGTNTGPEERGKDGVGTELHWDHILGEGGEGG